MLLTLALQKKSTASLDDKAKLAFEGLTCMLVGIGLSWIALQLPLLFFFIFEPGAIWAGIQKFIEIGGL